MNDTSGFAWSSSLGIAVALFLAYGALDLFVGVASGLIFAGLFGPDVGNRALFNTAEYDRMAFGLDREPIALLRDDPLLAGLRRLLLIVVSGLLTALGALVIAVAWSGLREGQAWAMWALTIAGVAVIPYWILALLPYTRAGVVGLAPFSVPPFMGLTTVLLIPALVLGWSAMLRS